MTFPVKFFHSGMSGAPVLSPTTIGSAYNLLKACLIDGFGSVTLDSLVVSSEVATATVSAGHGFALMSDVVGPVILIAGATDTALNGEWRVLTSGWTSTVFTFSCPGVSDGTKAGTITAKRAPQGEWDWLYSDGTGAVLRSRHPDAPGIDIKISDTEANAWSYTFRESPMSSLTDGTDLAGLPAAGKAYQTWGNPPWYLVADGRTVMLGYRFYGGLSRNSYLCYWFGAYSSFVPNDAVNFGYVRDIQSFLRMNDATVSGYRRVATFAGAFSGTIDMGINIPTRIGGTWPGHSTFPALLDSAHITLVPLGLNADNNGGCGALRGAFCPLHNNAVLPANLTAVPAPGGRAVMIVDAYVEYSSQAYIGKMAIDIVGPWA